MPLPEGFPLNLKTVRDKLKPLGLTISWLVGYKEFRVNFQKGRESTAYYTDDLLDALKTGQAMALGQLQAEVDELNQLNETRSELEE